MSEDVNPQPGDRVACSDPDCRFADFPHWRLPCDKGGRVVERATPNAPDNPYRHCTPPIAAKAWDKGFEAGRLAGLQAPPDLEPRLRTAGLFVEADQVRDIVAFLDDSVGGLQAPPVDDEPVGWANRYPEAWGNPRVSPEEARALAVGRSVVNAALEVAVPLYRRPGVQNPAAESEWIMCPECEGDGVTDEYEVCDACHGEGGISAGVQSPPATPGWVVIAGDEVVSDAYSFDDLAVAAKFATDHGGQLCKVVPVPDPETETTDG